MNKLITHKANLNAVDKNGENAIWKAVKSNITTNQKIDIIKHLVNKGVNINHANQNQETPLHWSINNSQDDLPLFLLEMKADYRTRTPKGFSTIDLAKKRNRTDIVETLQYLFNKQETPVLLLPPISQTTSNKSDSNPFEHANNNLQQSPKNPYLKLSQQELTKNTEKLHNALQNHADEADIFKLIQKGIDPNIAGKTGSSATMLAFKLGNRNAINHILNLKPNIDITDENLNTPLFWAVAYQFEDIVELLLKRHHAQTNTQNKEYLTPLMKASSDGNYRLVKLLLEHNANRKISDDMDNTALNYANNEDVANLLNT